jgi:uncharacterized protein (UPF0332 family)
MRRLGTSKHAGALALFDREFAKTGVLPRELSRSLHLAFERRQTYDYGEMAEVTPQIATEAVAEATAFVAAVEAHLRSLGHLAKA